MIELVDQQRAPRHQEKCMVNITNPFIACTQLAGETGPITLVTFCVLIVTENGIDSILLGYLFYLCLSSFIYAF